MCISSICQSYFNWLYNTTIVNQNNSYYELLYFLFSIPFYVKHPMDQNRVEDGIELRYTFGNSNSIPYYIVASEIDDRPCSVLEVMTSLAMRMESIADDPDEGDRTSFWFMRMIQNLGLDGMIDSIFNYDVALTIITRFMDRDYDSNGNGGLFAIRNPKSDLKTIELWYQAMWYLTEQLLGDG